MQFAVMVSKLNPKLGAVTIALTESMFGLLSKHGAAASTTCPPAVCQLYCEAMRPSMYSRSVSVITSSKMKTSMMSTLDVSLFAA